MNRRVSIIVLGLALVGFAVGLAWLQRLRISGGDVFPPYSSFRADPLGSRAFFEALSELPDLRVERWAKAIDRLRSDEPSTILLLGLRRSSWDMMPAREAQALELAAAAGSRVVIVFHAEKTPAFTPPPPKLTPAQEAAKKRRDEEKSKHDKELPEEWKPAAWGARLGVEVKQRPILDLDRGALREESAAADLPSTVPWKSDLYFKLSENSGWKVIYTRGKSPVMLERIRGHGSIVLATDAYFVSNEALGQAPQSALLSWLIGPSKRVLFVESHLGVEEDVGVATLARRYGLAACFFTLVLLAALWIWKRMALFVPPAPAAGQLTLRYQQTAGLEALLRRAIPPAQLITTCLAEWGGASRPGEAEAARDTLSKLPPGTNPADAYNAVARALKQRRRAR